MRKVALFSLLLLAGLVGSQILPTLLGSTFTNLALPIQVLTMVALAFIMIQVGREFEIDKTKLSGYGKDYLVAMTAAAFPWIFVTAYFLLVMLPAGSWQQGDAWKETLLAGRFAAPTSAGVLFSMLAAAGLGATWMFKKTRILAIFDDLDTVLLMIPLKMLMVGMAWQLGLIVVLMAGMLWVAWRWLNCLNLPNRWPWILFYSSVIVGISELIYHGSKTMQADVPIHIEVLLPAFVLGCIMKPDHKVEQLPQEKKVATTISAAFMVLVGLSMPTLFGSGTSSSNSLTGAMPAMSGWQIAGHVLAVSILANLGKIFPLFCYRDEASWKERLAVCVAMWPRGEVGAGVLILALGYGIGGPVVTVAVLSLALNLACTGLFILMVRKLLVGAAKEKNSFQAESIRSKPIRNKQPQPALSRF